MPNVDTVHKDYSKYLSRWAKCRDVADGEVKEKKQLYLPPLSGHDGPVDPEYMAYVQRAHYYNATGRTIDALSGAVFSEDPTLTLPAKIEPLTEDVTLTGCSLDELANQIMEELLIVGRFGVLVDHMGRGEEVTVQIAEARNIRAKLVPYKAEQIINWRYGLMNGRHQLVLVVLKEVYDEPKEDIFQTEQKTRYRVLRLDEGRYIQEVYEQDGKEFSLTSSAAPSIGSTTFDYIPFFLFGPCNAQEIEQPPLWDLVEANLAHYRTSADLEHGLHFTGLPTLFGSGWKMQEGEVFPIGSSNAYVRSEENADAKFIEFTGTGLGALETSLERKESHMASLGARLLQESPRGVETAQAVNTKQSGENSVLASLAKSEGKGLTWCMTIFAEWMSAPGEVLIELNTDYIPDSVDAPTITALVGACQKGLLTKETFAYNLQRGGYLPDGQTPEDEAAQAEEEDIPPPGIDEFGQPTDPAQNQPPQAANA